MVRLRHLAPVLHAVSPAAPIHSPRALRHTRVGIHWDRHARALRPALPPSFDLTSSFFRGIPDTSLLGSLGSFLPVSPRSLCRGTPWHMSTRRTMSLTTARPPARPHARTPARTHAYWCWTVLQPVLISSQQDSSHLARPNSNPHLLVRSTGTTPPPKLHRLLLSCLAACCCRCCCCCFA